MAANITSWGGRRFSSEAAGHELYFSMEAQYLGGEVASGGCIVVVLSASSTVVGRRVLMQPYSCLHWEGRCNIAVQDSNRGSWCIFC